MNDESTKSQAERNTSWSPEQMAMVNAMIQGAVTEVFKQMAPVFKDMALTPEKMLEMEQARQKASPEYEARQKLDARLKRERDEFKRQDAEARHTTEEMKKNCRHVDSNGRTSICLVHNHPDRQPRGVCPVCNDWIHPAEWRIASDEAEALKLTGGDRERVREEYRGGPRRAYLVKAHKDYAIVLDLNTRQ